MDFHASLLDSVCRMGGKKFVSCSQATRYPVGDYAAPLLAVFQVDVSKDVPNVHPQYLCALCERTLARAAKSSHCGGGCGPPIKWMPHSRTECDICKTLGKKSKGGRPPKRKSLTPCGAIVKRHKSSEIGRSTADQDTVMCGMDVSIEEVIGLATPANRAGVVLERDRFIDSTAVEECSICKLVVDQAVQAKCCENLFCAPCICTWLESHDTCAACRQQMTASGLATPCKPLCRVISRWGVHCDYQDTALAGCPTVVALQDLKGHVKDCPFNPASPATPIRTVSKSATVEEILTASPSKLRGNVADRLTGHLVTAKAEDGRLEVKSSSQGKPQVFTRTTVCSVPSSRASARTMQRRSTELERVQDVVYGGPRGHRAAGLAAVNSQPTPGTALAIKADLSLPWSQLRKLRRWLTAFGVELESEQTIRSFIAKRLPQYTAKNLPFVKKNGEVSVAAAVFFPSLVEIVMHYLDVLDGSGRLYWHNGAIPAAEVWIKIGGDHGGGSFKLCMQVANILHPNALSNTVPICIFTEKDSPANLETALSLYRQQLVDLMGKQWHDKAIRVFLFGDYEFQTVMYGLSGSSGVRPCLHCLCTKRSMQEPPSDRCDADAVERSLNTLAVDYERFANAGSILAKAKQFNNVIRPAILPVPVENAVIPVLHLDLGVFPWLFDAFEREVRQLDIRLAAKCSVTGDDSSGFTALSEQYERLEECTTAVSEATAKASLAQQHLHFLVLFGQQQNVVGIEALAGNLQMEALAAAAEVQQCDARRRSVEESIEKLGRSKEFRGPCASSIEPVLQLHNIQRQAYHGGAFIGNHIHRALKPAVVTAITEAPYQVVLSRCPPLADDANVLSARYAKLLTEYAACRAIISSCSMCDDDQLEQLGQCITSFLRSCRKEVAERKLGNITPKLHLLEQHTLPLMRRVKVGLGLLGEQGAESIHAAFNTLERRYSSIPAQLQRMKSVAEQHLISTMPENEDKRPEVTRRHRKPRGAQ